MLVPFLIIGYIFLLIRQDNSCYNIKNNIILSKVGVIMCILYIKKFRHFRRMTQQELAEKVNVSQQYIAMIEADNIVRTRSPRIALLEQIAWALHICLIDLIYCSCKDCENNNICLKKDKVNYENIIDDNLEFYI